MTDTSNALKPVLTFLQQYAPFCQMLPAHQEYLAMHLEQVFYAENDNIVLPQDGVSDSLYIIKNGCVSGEFEQETVTAKPQKVAQPVEKIEPGHCFPIDALVNKRAVNFQHRAIKSTICYRLTQSHFEYLMQQSIIFHDFILKQ